MHFNFSLGTNPFTREEGVLYEGAGTPDYSALVPNL